MYRVFFILLITSFIFLASSCKQNSSQSERDYIKNLEEKNKLLEDELNERRVSKKNKTAKEQTEVKVKKGYFTIGSSEDEVLEIMGDPESYIDLG